MSSRAILLRQSGRYIWGGAICAVLHNAIVIGLAFAGVPYTAALVVSFFATTPVGYLFHTAVTFGEPRSWDRLIRFMGGCLAGFGWSSALMIAACSVFGMSVVVATPLVTAIVFLWNFAAARWAIVRGKS